MNISVAQFSASSAVSSAARCTRTFVELEAVSSSPAPCFCGASFSAMIRTSPVHRIWSERAGIGVIWAWVRIREKSAVHARAKKRLHPAGRSMRAAQGWASAGQIAACQGQRVRGTLCPARGLPSLLSPDSFLPSTSCGSCEKRSQRDDTKKLLPPVPYPTLLNSSFNCGCC